MSPPEPELGVILKLPDFSADIDPGPREFFPGSESMLVRPVILDNSVPDPGRYLPESGVVADGPGSANDCGAGSGKPFPRYGGVLSAPDSLSAIENEGPPCEYGARLRILDCGNDIEMGDEVHWPGLVVLNIFSGSGQDPGRSLPGVGREHNAPRGVQCYGHETREGIPEGRRGVYMVGIRR